jgi:hypothetical protein
MKRKTRDQLSSRNPGRSSKWTVDDDQQTRLEAELAASGRNDAVPREGVIGAHLARREVVAGEDGEPSPMDEPIAGGAEVAPTERAMARERERHRLQREIGVVPAGESGDARQHRAPGVDRAALDAAGARADQRVR